MSKKPLSPITDTPGNDFLSLLKQNTQPLHQALERTSMSRLLMSPTLDRATYARILYGFYGAFTSLEFFLTKVATLIKTDELEGLIDLRAPLALEDIRDLTGTFDAALPLDKPFTKLDYSIPAALGVLYVLEGSKLGGKVISRQIQRTIGITPTEGGRFFANAEGLGLAGWQLFRVQCATYAECYPEHNEAIIQSANDTFSYLHDYFVRHYSALA